MSTSLTKGFVLKRESWNEYDCLYTIYTERLGKVKAITKGAKKVLSKLGSHLEPFFEVELMIVHGRAWPIIAAAKAGSNYSIIKQDYHRIIIAAYFMEALNNLVDCDYYDKYVFDVLKGFINDLADHDSFKDDVIILNKYLYNLLKYLGYQPVVKSNNQKRLVRELYQAVVAAGEKDVNSFHSLKVFI